MKTIIIATWRDAFGQIFNNEYFTNELDATKIMEMYITEKLSFGKQPIDIFDDTCVFSDGTRVVLSLGTLRDTVSTEKPFEEEGVIDVSPETYRRIPSDFNF